MKRATSPTALQHRRRGLNRFQPTTAPLLHAIISQREPPAARAQWILGNWESMLEKFLKVFPHEYKRILNIPKVAQDMVPAAV
jgi:glutamate synthase domain-containing protein 3